MKIIRLCLRVDSRIFSPSANSQLTKLLNELNRGYFKMVNEMLIKVGAAYIGALTMLTVIMTVIH